MENKIIKDYKIKFLSHCFVGVIFLLIGIAEISNIINVVDNSKAKVFLAMAIIAFATSIGPFFNYYLLKKESTTMEAIIVAENDEYYHLHFHKQKILILISLIHPYFDGICMCS